jgi:DNA (cytosine-5)-methyltransferase 1
VRYGSVCSGVEAATVAWHPLGWTPAFFSEIEAFPRSVLAHHYPDVPLHGNFTTIKGDEYGSIDLLVGGTPCQDFSVAGLRAGIAGDRGNLTLEFIRLAARTTPRWIVWENVPGVLSSDGGRALGAFLGGLAQLGYGFAYRVLDAQYFGLAQRRSRVFVVGCLGDWRRAAAVLFESESLQGDPAPRRASRERTAPTPAARTRGGGGLGTDAELDGALITTDCVGALTAKYATTNGAPEVDAGLYIAHALKAEGHDASEDGTGRGVPLWPVEVAPTLSAHFGDKMGLEDQHALNGAGLFVAHAFEWQRGASQNLEFNEEQEPPIVRNQTPAVAFDTTQITSPGNQGGDYIQTAMQVRRLTPRECERLQGFPDDYTLVPHRGKPAADGPRYKALGNSMAVPVMAWIGQRIAMVEALDKQEAA